MPVDPSVLQDYVATANSGKYNSYDEINAKFPELEGYDKQALQDYVATANSGKYSSYEELNTKFPELLNDQKPTTWQGRLKAKVTKGLGSMISSESVKKKDVTESSVADGLSASQKEKSKWASVQSGEVIEGLPTRETFKEHEVKDNQKKDTPYTIGLPDPFNNNTLQTEIIKAESDNATKLNRWKQEQLESSPLASEEVLDKMLADPEYSKQILKEIYETAQASNFREVKKSTRHALVEAGEDPNFTNKLTDKDVKTFFDQYLDFKDSGKWAFLVADKPELKDKEWFWTERTDRVNAAVEYPLHPDIGIGKLKPGETADFISGRMKDIDVIMSNLSEKRKALSSDYEAYKADPTDAKYKELEQRNNELLKEEYMIYYAADRVRRLSDKYKVSYAKHVANQEKKGNTAGVILKGFTSGTQNLGNLVMNLGADVIPYILPSAFEVTEEDLKLAKENGVSVRSQKSNELHRWLEEEVAPGMVEFADLGTTDEYIQSTDRSDLVKAMSFVSESLGSAMSGGGSGNLTKLAFFSQSYNNMRAQMSGEEFDGLSIFEKNLIAVPYGVVIGELEHLGFVASTLAPSKFLSKFAPRVISKSLRELPKDASEAMIKRKISSNVSARIADGSVKIIGGSLVEAGTEGSQALVEIGIKDLVNSVKEKEFFDIPDLTTSEGRKEATNMVIEEAYYGALGGLIMSVPSTSYRVIKEGINNKSLNQDFELFYNSVMDEETRSLAIIDLKIKVSKGEITKEEAEAQVTALDDVYSIMRTIPEEINSGGKRDSFNLIKERKDLEKKIEGKDKALVEKETLRINEINEELKSISTGVVVEDGVSIKDPVKPETPKGAKLFSDPNPETKQIADKYKKDKGITTPEGEAFRELDEARAKEISDAYQEMKDNPKNPEVKEAYEAMASETMDQYQAMQESGYTIELWEGEGEPYANSGEMIADVRDNKHMYVLSTESEFGADPISDQKRADNPLLKDSGVKDVNNKTLLINDIFRGVHDFFGHTERGNSFGPKGEENAWDVHARMYSDKARRAMTTETRGQNSYVNFSGVNAEAKAKFAQANKLEKEGKIDEANKLREEARSEFKFADQKMGLMPEEFSNIEEKYTKELITERINDNQVPLKRETFTLTDEDGNVNTYRTTTALDGSLKHVMILEDGTTVPTKVFGKLSSMEDIKHVFEKEGDKLEIITTENYQAVMNPKMWDRLSDRQKKAVDSERFNKETPSIDIESQKVDIEKKRQEELNKIEEVKKVEPISAENSSNYANMTEDGEGNFVFYHFSDETRDVVDPKKHGTNKGYFTTSEEKAAIAKVGGVAMYYTSPRNKETGVGGAGHMVKIPKENVYDANTDPLNLKEEAKARHDKEHPNKGYDSNSEMAYMTVLAEEAGYEMLVGEWEGRTRAQTVTTKTPSEISVAKGNLVEKAFESQYESNKEKGFVPVIPEGKKTKYDAIYKEIYKERNKAGNYDDLYHLAEQHVNLSQEEITSMIMESDISQEIKDKYQEALAYEPESRRSEIPRPLPKDFTSSFNKGADKGISWIDEQIKKLDDHGKGSLGMNLPIPVAKAALKAAKKAIQAGKSLSEIFEAVIKSIQKSGWYGQLKTDKERRDAEKLAQRLLTDPDSTIQPRAPKGKTKKQKDIEKGTVSKKRTKIKVDEYAALKDQLKTEARGARRASKFEKDNRKAIHEYLKTKFKGFNGKVDGRRVGAILNRALTMNLSDPTMAARFNEYVEKVIDDAKRIQKIDAAYEISSQIKRMANVKDVQATMKTMGLNFASIDPLLTEDIDAYLEIADKVKALLTKSKALKKGKGIEAFKEITWATRNGKPEIDQYIKDQIEATEEIEKNLLLSSYSELEKDGVIKKSDSLKMIKQKIAEFKRDEKAQDAMSKKAEEDFIKEVVEEFEVARDSFTIAIESGVDPVTGKALTEAQMEALELLAEAQVKDIKNIKDIMFVRDLMINFSANGVTDMLASKAKEIKGRAGARMMKGEVKDGATINKKGLNYWAKSGKEWFMRQAGSIDQNLRMIFKDTDLLLKFKEWSGFGDLENGTAKAKNLNAKAKKRYHKKWKNKKPNKIGFYDKYNVYQRAIYAHLIRNSGGTIEEVEADFQRRLKVIIDTYEYLSATGFYEGETRSLQEDNEAALLGSVLKNLGITPGSNFTMRDLDAKTNKVNKAAVNDIIELWEGSYDEMSEAMGLLYNSEFDKDVNYTHDSWSRKDGVSDDVEQLKATLDGGAMLNLNDGHINTHKSGALMETTKPSNVRGKRRLNFEFEQAQFRAYEAALMDVHTAGAIHQMKGFFESKDAAAIATSEELEIIKDKLYSFLQRERGHIFHEERESKTLNKALNGVALYSTSLALGGVKGLVLQTIPAYTASFFTAGRAALGMASNYWVRAKSIDKWIDNEGIDLSLRGAKSHADISMNESQMSSAQRINEEMQDLSDAAGVAEKVAKGWIENFLVVGDRGITKAMFLTYYKKYYISEKGMSMVQATKKANEHISANKMDPKAREYAKYMLNTYANVSNEALMGDMFTKRDASANVLRKILFPYATFIMNQKTRSFNDAHMIISKGVTNKERGRSIAGLSGTVAELFTYSALRVSYSVMVYSLMSSFLGWDDEEDDPAVQRLVKKENDRRRYKNEKPLSDKSEPTLTEFKNQAWRSMQYKKIMKGAASSAVSDFISPVPMTDNAIKKFVNWAVITPIQREVYDKELKEAIAEKNNEIHKKTKGAQKEMTPFELEKFITDYEEEEFFGLYDSDWGDKGSFGVISVGLDAMSEIGKHREAAVNGKVEIKGSDGRVTVKYLTKEDQEKANSVYNIKTMTSLLGIPPDIGGYAHRKGWKIIEKSALTINQLANHDLLVEFLDENNFDPLTEEEMKNLKSSNKEVKGFLKEARPYSEEYVKWLTEDAVRKAKGMSNKEYLDWKIKDILNDPRFNSEDK